jgi:hypothetical protein
MVDSIEFRSTDWNSAIDLSECIIKNDERAISLPDTLYSEMINFAKDQDDSSEMITIVEGNEDGNIYIIDFTRDPHNYGVFIAFKNGFRHIYLTTGISATDYLIELIYKRALRTNDIKTTGNLYKSASAVSDYLDADIRYPDVGIVRTRVEEDVE